MTFSHLKNVGHSEGGSGPVPKISRMDVKFSYTQKLAITAKNLLMYDVYRRC